MGDPHPTFANPTIIQATCEIGFTREGESKLSTRVLYELFGSEFPELHPLANMNVQIFVGHPGVVGQPPGQIQPVAPQGFQFSTSASDKLVQISGTNFVYTVTGQYLGWREFKGRLIDLWTRANQAVAPQKITKIGLRYINRIVKDADHPYLSDWLKASADLPAALIASRGHFFGRTETTLQSGNLKLITLGNQDASPDLPDGAIILDIDRVSSDELDNEIGRVSEKLEILHDDVWDVFWSARTPALEAKLNGK